MLKKKIVSSYTKPVKKAINTITYKNFPNTLPVGSYTYKFQKYPGDIDIMEYYSVKGNAEEATDKIVKMIQNIVRDVQKEPNTYFADFKAGNNKDFEIFIGVLNYKTRTITGYNYNEVLMEINKLNNEKFITKEEFKKIKKLVIKKPSFRQFEYMAEFFRNKFIIRWSPSEILKGKKRLPPQGKEIAYLDNEIYIDEIVKLDTWNWINNRYIEMTNFMSLEHVEKGKHKSINQGAQDIIKNFTSDIIKYLTDVHRNPFKALKRIWSLSIALKDNKTTKKIEPLINSGYSILYQVWSDMKVLKDMIENIKKLPYINIGLEAEEFKGRLSYIWEFSFNEEKVDKDIDKLVLFIKKKDRKNMLNILNKSVDNLGYLLNQKVTKYIKDNKLFNIPKIYFSGTYEVY